MQSNSLLRLTIRSVLGISALTVVPALAHAADAPAADQQSIEALRNTLVGVMEALVQKGLLTREQAAQIVASAQAKADATAKDKATQEAAEKDAVRVTYVPEIVRAQISEQVKAELRPEVTREVIAQAKAEKWGVPAAMPDWLSRISLNGDMRLRFQNDSFAADNIANTYKNYLAINTAGGDSKAGRAEFLNTTEDRFRERLRLRVGLDAKVNSDLSVGVRLATGSLTDPVSTNQTLGNSANRIQFAVDQAYLRYDLKSDNNQPWLTLWGGRMPNPWVSTDLVWDPDLQFEGVAGKWRYNFNSNQTAPHNAFLTLGAFPLQEVELSAKDKWLYGAQVGLEWPWSSGGRLVVAGAYYYFDQISGKQNAPNLTTLNYTAPQALQKGNTVFDILNDADGSTSLYALAADFHEINVTAALELPLANHLLTLTADYVSNPGFDQRRVLQRSGYASLLAVPEDARLLFDKQTTGAQLSLSFGTEHVDRRGDWRTEIAYKYLERDAVVDAFTDSDFNLGGTGAKGYSLKAEWWFLDRSWLTLRYLSSNAITKSTPSADGTKLITDASPFGVDTAMLDINGRF